MTKRIIGYMSKFENAEWKTMVGVAIFVPGVGLATFAAFCGLKAYKTYKRYAR